MIKTDILVALLVLNQFVLPIYLSRCYLWLTTLYFSVINPVLVVNPVLGAMSGYSSDKYSIRALMTCLLYDSVFHLKHENIEIINSVPIEYFHATFNEIISQFQ